MVDAQKLMWLFGVVFAGLGVAARLGRWKNWYWRSRGAVYSYIPLGLLFIVYSFYPQARNYLGRNYIFYQGLVALLVLCGLWWSLRPPQFLKPSWVRWVEKYPREVYELMAKAVAQGENWEANVGSAEELEAWVKSLRSKKRKKSAS